MSIQRFNCPSTNYYRWRRRAQLSIGQPVVPRVAHGKYSRKASLKPSKLAFQQLLQQVTLELVVFDICQDTTMGSCGW